MSRESQKLTFIETIFHFGIFKTGHSASFVCLDGLTKFVFFSSFLSNNCLSFFVWFLVCANYFSLLRIYAHLRQRRSVSNCFNIPKWSQAGRLLWFVAGEKRWSLCNVCLTTPGLSFWLMEQSFHANVSNTWAVARIAWIKLKLIWISIFPSHAGAGRQSERDAIKW